MRKTHSTARRLMGALQKDLPLPQRLREGLRVVLEQPGMAEGAQAALFLDTEAGGRRVAETGSPPGGWGLEPGAADPPEGCRRVPLCAGGRRIGLLVLYSPGSGETPGLEPALDEAAGLLAAALAWARQTQRQAALLALGEGETFLLDARGRPVLVHGTPANPGPFPEWGAEAAAFFRELLEHPLQSHGRVLRLGKRRVSVRGCNLLPDPLVAGVALTVADVTEKAQAERAREVLSRVADLLIRAGEGTPFLAGVCRLLVEAGYGLAWVGWARPGFAVEQVAAAGATAYLEGLEVTWDEGPTGQGPSGQALRTGRAALMRFIRDDPAYAPWRERALAHGFESSLGLPVEVGGRALGVLSLYAPEPDAFSAEELGLLERLASLVGRRAGAHALSQVVEPPEPVLIPDLLYAAPPKRGGVRALAQQLALNLRLRQDLLEFTNRALAQGVTREVFQAALQRAVSHTPGAREGHLFLRDPDGHYRHVARVGSGRDGLKGLWVEPEGLRALELGAAVGWVQEPALSLEPMLYARIEAEGEVFGVLYLGGPVSAAASGVAGLFAAQMALWLRWQQSQEEVSFLAYHDSLTGLPNRRRLREEGSICREGPGGVVLIDLDGFKAVNDTLGHTAGDRLLQETASRLRAALPPEGRIFRMGGDEFAALLPGPPEEVQRALQQMRRAMEPPVVLDSKLVRISFSAGIAYCPLDGQDLSTLLGRADLALYRAKGQPTRTAFYDQALEAALYRRQDLLMALSHALAEGELLLHFQPIVGLENQQPVAYEALEALVRWPGGPAPAVFIPLAEETGLVKELDRYVLTRVAALAQGRTVSVNLSVQSLTDAGFVAFLAGLPNRENVVLEITERVLAHPETFAVLQEVAGLGFRLALDDFGSGYSSLGYLARMPFYALKVDGLFTQGIGENPRAEAVLRAVRDLARNLGLAVVVEGVETDAQRGWLLAEGFAWGQGFLFGRPAPMESFGGEG